jgi:hypothetical protein
MLVSVTTQQARPASGKAFALPQAKLMKIKPKYSTARLRMSIISMKGLAASSPLTGGG